MSKQPTPFALALGKRLAELRGAAGLTQSALAAALGVGQSRVAEWEAGARAPSGEYLALLSLALGVSLSAFDGLRPLARRKRQQ